MRRTRAILQFGLLTAIILTSGCASRMFYYPTQHIHATPTQFDLAYEDIHFDSLDGTPLHAWLIPATTPESKGTVIHFHGNAQNVTTHFQYSAWLAYHGYDVFVFDYRGFGQSGGKPSRKGIHHDSCAAMNYIRSRKDIDSERLFVLGQSLGGTTALAALAASGTDGVQAIVIDSTFYSYRSIVRDKMQSIPVLSLMRWPLSGLIISNQRSAADTIREIDQVPLLIMHGTEDRIVPYSHAEKLYRKANDPKELLPVVGGSHVDAFIQPNAGYRKAVASFFDAAIE